MKTLTIIFLFISIIAFGQESDPYGFYTGWDTTYAFTDTIYFDPDYSGTETGSYSQPYNHITDVTLADNTDYLFKRGSTMETNSTINFDISNARFRAYGSGTTNPIIHKTTADNSVIQVRHSNNQIVFDSLDIKGYTHVYEGGVTRGIYFDIGNDGDINDVLISNCSVYNHGNGILSLRVATDAYMDSLTIRNTNVYDCGLEGMWFQNTRHGLAIDCHVYDINLYWHTSGSHLETIAGGDCFQLGGNSTDWYIYDNILDKQSTSNKFALACVQKDNTVPLTMYVRGNTMYPPKDTAEGSGAVLQFFQSASRPETMVVFERNYISGRVRNGSPGLGAGQYFCDTLYMNYNIFDSTNGNSTGIINEYCNKAEVYNNVFIGGDRSTTQVFTMRPGDLTLRNNLFAGNSSSDPLNIASVGSIDSSYNYRTNSTSSTWNSYLSITDWETSDFSRTSDLNDGVDVGLDYDNNGNAVGNPPERGALEYQAESVQTNTLLKSGGKLLKANGKFIEK